MGGGAGATTGVLISSLLSYVQFFFFFFSPTCQVKKKKSTTANETLQRRPPRFRFERLFCPVLLSVYKHSTWVFFHDPQPPNLLLASQRLAPDSGAYGPQGRSLAASASSFASLLLPHWPRGQWRAGLGPRRVKGCSRGQ